MSAAGMSPMLVYSPIEGSIPGLCMRRATDEKKTCGDGDRKVPSGYIVNLLKAYRNRQDDMLVGTNLD